MKKKYLKSASIVALSAVMMCGAAVSFAGCGGNDAYTISISMFCGDSDVDVNRQNCLDWAAQYTQKLREAGTFSAEEEVKIKFSYQSDTPTYFTTLSNQISSNNQPDVFYVSPKYVKVWSRMNKIIDLSETLAQNEEDVEKLKDVWEDSLAAYAYSKADTFTPGDRIQFNNDTKRFETISNHTEVGIYGLPKDYSNFGLGFNEVLFESDPTGGVTASANTIKEALTTPNTFTTRDNVKGAEYLSAQVTYGADDADLVTREDGQPAGLINIGVPTWYKPYNFYRFASFTAALEGGDPMATAVQVTTGGKGYCVTIPGWPGDTFEDAKAYWGDNVNIAIENPDTNAEYDAEQGYITYTYAEYSALTWAITYYLNTYNWQNNGKGGVKIATGDVKNVYGNDQYDGVLYLLPWLAGNNAQYLNQDSTKAINGEDGTVIGHDTYKTTKLDIHGANNEVDINWGLNNEEFLETVGAFYAYGSDWNGNSNNAGDTDTEKSSGWDLFVAGNCVFYGVGTWNMGPLNATSRTYLKYRLMPEPVREDLALASVVKGEDYQMRAYGDATWTNGAATLTKSSYTGQEIADNQKDRQDQWGARMDSVGYGVSANIDKGGDWRRAAGVDLVRYLTITPETQVTLTYAGSQLPNFKSQCVDFYKGNEKENGSFKEMITPDDGAAWDKAYAVANKMRAETNKNQTVKEWMAANGEGLDYDTQYDSTTLDKLIDLSYNMKVLRLVSYRKQDRDLSLRMQYGLNAVRDSAMYTYNDNWLTRIDGRGTGYLMAYVQQLPYAGTMSDMYGRTWHIADASSADRKGKTPISGNAYGTPAWFYLYSANDSQKDLDAAIATEQRMLGNN